MGSGSTTTGLGSSITGSGSGTTSTGSDFGSGDTNGSTDDLKKPITISSSTTGITLNNIGGGQPHNNMPPYIVKYMWERTA